MAQIADPQHASGVPPPGRWRDDDFDVLADGEVLGRIMHAGAGAMTEALLGQGRVVQ
jgi:hypothetical protein